MKINYILMLVLLMGCAKSNPVDNTQYYVKYIVNGGASYPLVISSTSGLKVNLTNEKNSVDEYIRGNATDYEFSIGPVKNGFTANLTATRYPALASSNLFIKPRLQILVSINNGPFVLKKEGLSSVVTDSATISYKIE